MNKFKLNEKISFSGIDIQQKKIGVKINTSIARVIETNKFILSVVQYFLCIFIQKKSKVNFLLYYPVNL